MLKREIWERQADLCNTRHYPKLPCPYCNEQETLELDQNSFVYRSHGKRSLSEIDSMKKKHLYSEANSIWGILLGIAEGIVEINKDLIKFSGFFECNNCDKTVSAAGTGTIIRPIAGEADSFAATPDIKVEYFSPPVPIFELSTYLPDKVKGELLHAFNHYHSDLTSSGIKVRKALELLCQALDYEGKSLHEYTKKFEAEFPQYQDLLSSMRLLGNEAAHGSNIKREDLLDAFEIFSHIQNAFRDRKDRVNAQKTAQKLTAKYKKK